MRQVITINLHNNAYQVEDEGFRALQDYLSTAEQQLAGNPDCTEILADLEQAIAEKCDAYLSAHKNVVTAGEVARILREMGPVTSADSTSQDAANTSEPASGQQRDDAAQPRPQTHTRRLFRLEEGKLWGGVCTGLAAYLGIDVVWVRVVWVLMTLFTGVWLLVYIAALFIVPLAQTTAERAQAHGAPFNAQDLVDGAREHYAKARQKYSEYRSQFAQSKSSARRWKRDFEQWQRLSHRKLADALPRPSLGARVVGALLLPFFAIVSAALFVAVGSALALLVTGTAVQHWGWSLDGMPLWLPVLALLLAYGLIALPVGAGRRMALHYANGGQRYGWADMWSGIIWLGTVALLLWGLHEAVPELRQLFEQWLLNLRVEDAITTVTL
jgi:phage shock protein PspC (stress-responsive transcriptional regulator)